MAERIFKWVTYVFVIVVYVSIGIRGCEMARAIDKAKELLK